MKNDLQDLFDRMKNPPFELLFHTGPRDIYHETANSLSYVRRPFEVIALLPGGDIMMPVKVAAKLLGYRNERSIYPLLRGNSPLPHLVFGKQTYRISLSDLLRYIEDSSRGGDAPSNMPVPTQSGPHSPLPTLPQQAQN